MSLEDLMLSRTDGSGIIITTHIKASELTANRLYFFIWVSSPPRASLLSSEAWALLTLKALWEAV
jgi:hypothetical protein